MATKSNYIIAYDIKCPKRLGRVHRYLKSCAIPIQYSVFIARLYLHEKAAIIEELQWIINEKQDDIRIYRLPQKIEAVFLGERHIPEGIMLSGEIEIEELQTKAGKKIKQMLHSQNRSVIEVEK